MKKAVIFILVLSLLNLSIPQKTFFAEKTKTVVITVDSLNVRSGAGLSYQVVAGVKKNEKFEVMEQNGEWLKIKISNHQSGWVAGWLVSELEPETKQEGTTSINQPGKIEVIVNGLRIRSGPGISFQVISSVNRGDSVILKEISENWAKITFNQIEGWVHSDYLTGIPTEPKVPSELPAIKKKGIITTNSLNVRDIGSLNGAIIGKVTMNENVNIISMKTDWYEIHFENSNGWIHRDYVKISSESDPIKGENDPPASSEDKQTIKKATVKAAILNVRSDFSLSGTVISQVKKGDQLEILSEQNNWCQIKLTDGKNGWVAGWYLEKETISTPPVEDSIKEEISTVNILYDRTNIRSGPSTTTDVILRAKLGETFTIVEKIDEWYKINITPSQVGYVAGWIVSTVGKVEKVERPGMNQYVTGKTIVIDPGHGGRDSGAKGVRGTIEKTLTLRTAKLLEQKLRAAGAKSVLTRNQDSYVSLNNRVSLAHYYQADAFLSLHYDSSLAASAKGITTYYYSKSKDYNLGRSIHTEFIKNTSMSDRGVVYGNYHVLRQNKRPAVLIEFGFLSNISEEAHITTSLFQDQVTTAIFNGLAQQFKK